MGFELMEHAFLWSEGLDMDSLPCFNGYWKETTVRRQRNGFPLQCELEIENEGRSFHTIIGQYTAGYYLCIPYKSAGCALAGDLGSPQWNSIRLLKALKDDSWLAWMICHALRDYRNMLWALEKQNSFYPGGNV